MLTTSKPGYRKKKKKKKKGGERSLSSLFPFASLALAACMHARSVMCAKKKRRVALTLHAF